MARPKPAWRRVLTARHVRWALSRAFVWLIPAAERWLGFFPRGVDMIEAADEVLADRRDMIGPDAYAADRGFLDRCLRHDSVARNLDLDRGVLMGPRTAVFRKAWLDMTAGSILLPHRRATVQMRSAGVNWNTCTIGVRRHVTVPGRVFLPLGTVQYFHLLLENGVRLIDLLESGTQTGPLTIVKPPDRTRAEAAMYEGIARLYGDVGVRHLPRDVLAVPDEVILHFPRGEHWEWPPVSRALADRLAEAFAAVYGTPTRGSAPASAPVAGTRLYLSRQGGKLRNVTNAASFEGLLAEHGFQTFHARDDNHPDQIARFAAAETVVAVHGAGLTNLLFCRPGTKVIEIFPENFVKSPYWWLCRQLSLEHVPVVGGPGDYDQNFEVDLDRLRPALA